MKAWQTWFRLMGYAPGKLAANLVLVFLRLAVQFVPALLLRHMFDALQKSGGLTVELLALVALLVTIALAQVVISISSIWTNVNFSNLAGALLRQNAIESIYQRPAGSALPLPVGDTVIRLGPGIPQVTRPLSFMLEQSLGAVTVLVAVWIMARTDILLAAAALVPLVIAAVASHRAGEKVNRLRHSSLAAEGNIGTFLREVFAGIQTIQVAGAEKRVAAHYARLNDDRRKRVLQESFFQDVLLGSFLQNASHLSTGLVLLLSWRSMQAGTFTVSDLALFTYFLPIISEFAMSVGQSFAAYRQGEAAIERLAEPLGPGNVANLTRHVPVYLSGPVPDIIAPQLPHPGEPLRSLEVSRLACLHPGSGRGIEEVSFRIEGGSFTAITGRVGSGKTTLVRAMLGLLPLDGGEIRWNGLPVSDPASFFIPPRAAYVRQSPGLFSASLRENILLGRSMDGLEQAVRNAALEADIPTLEHGLDTFVGPRGARLSGGQVQRAAVARAMACPAGLLVLDDISSALDVETEQRLWSGLKSLPVTLLVVTHRREALRQAGQVIVLKDGRVEAVGKLDDLLVSCQEMKELWASDLR